MKLLLTTTSFQDTPGKHQELLEQQDFDIIRKRGPLTADELKQELPGVQATICGDDDFNEEVLTYAKEQGLRIISKYGVGLDKIDLATAEKLGIKVTNCPGVNQTSVAEHVFGLMLSFCRNIPQEVDYVMNQKQWKRLTGTEIYQKTLLIMGLGKIGKEIAKRAKAFDLDIMIFEKDPDMEFIEQYGLSLVEDLDQVFPSVDLLSLNLPLNKGTEHIINSDRLQKAKKNLLIVNTARGKLVDKKALVNVLKNNTIKGYCADVLDREPMPKDEELATMDNVLITPHIGSRTFESVERQGTMAVENLLNSIKEKL